MKPSRQGRDRLRAAAEMNALSLMDNSGWVCARQDLEVVAEHYIFQPYLAGAAAHPDQLAENDPHKRIEERREHLNSLVPVVSNSRR